MSVHEQCLDEIVATIKGLKLPLPADTVVKRRMPWKKTKDQVVIHTGITVFPSQEQESAGTNVREDIGYGCGVTIILPVDASLTANVGKVLEIRELIRRKFIHQRLTTPTLSGGHYMTTKVQHLPINLPREAHQYEASSLLIRCWMREPRG